MTIYKSIKVKSKAYRKLMKIIGKWIEEGKSVEFDHRADDTVDVILHDE